MGDEELRKLQRDAAHGGAARIRVLAARFRAGALTREQLELAVHLGDDSAREVLGLGPNAICTCPDITRSKAHREQCPAGGKGIGTPPLRVPSEICAWTRGIGKWGKEAVVRASLATARLVFPIWQQRFPNSTVEREALEAGDAWVACPCSEHERASRVAASLVRGRTSRPSSGTADQVILMAVDTAWCAPTAAPGVAAQAVKLAVRQLGKGSVSQVRVAICSALLPWALTEHANVRTTRSSSGNRASSQRDDATLWAIMERIGGECGGGTAADLSRACEAFRAELEPLDDETLTAVVRAFDVAMSRAYTWDLRGAAYVIHGGCSTDSFWDFRAGLVSLGRDVFERSLRDPDSLVEIEDVRNRTLFEGFPNVPHEVLESRGLRVPGTTQHPRRLKGRAWSEEELPEKYPRLKAMFGA